MLLEPKSMWQPDNAHVQAGYTAWPQEYWITERDKHVKDRITEVAAAAERPCCPMCIG